MQTELLLDAIYEGTVDAKGWHRAAELLEKATGNPVVFSLPGSSPQGPGEIVAPSLEPAYIDAYRSRWYASDPFRRATLSAPVGTLVTHHAARCDAEATAFHREWLAPQGLHATAFLGSALDREGSGGTLLGIYGRDGAPPLGGQAMLDLSAVLPHLMRAARLYRQEAWFHSDRQAVLELLDQLRLGVVLLDEIGRPHATNRVADRILAERNGIRAERDGLVISDPDAARALEHATRSPPPEAPTAVRIARGPGERPLQAVLTPLARRGETGPTMHALFIADPHHRGAIPEELLRALHGLTPAEAALAAKLMAGANLKQAARDLNVTLGTVRERLGHVFAKTGTGRQAELVALLLSGLANLSWDP